MRVSRSRIPEGKQMVGPSLERPLCYLEEMERVLMMLWSTPHNTSELRVASPAVLPKLPGREIRAGKGRHSRHKVETATILVSITVSTTLD